MTRMADRRSNVQKKLIGGNYEGRKIHALLVSLVLQLHSIVFLSTCNAAI